MGAAKKYRGHYPAERGSSEREASHDKKTIELYREKIEKMLKNDPSARKKAADIISAMINSKK